MAGDRGEMLMELIARIKGFSIDYDTGRPILLLMLADRSKLSSLENLVGDPLRVTVAKFRKRRSLDSNAYFHVLLGQLADALKVSKPYMKNMLLRRYGQLDRTEDGGVIDFVIRDDLGDQIDEYELLHLAPTSKTGTMAGRTYRVYLKLKGSHELDTKEMGILLDGTIEECKAQGIDTASPKELEEMAKRWQSKVS